MHPHLPGDVRQHLVAVLELDTEHGVGQRLDDRAFDQDRVVLGLGQRASPPTSNCVGRRRERRCKTVLRRAGARPEHTGPASPGQSDNSADPRHGAGCRTSGPCVGDGDRVLEVGRAAAVGGDDGPAVVEELGRRPRPAFTIGSIASTRPSFSLMPRPPGRSSGTCGLLVHGGADAVADVLPHHR